MTTLPPRLRLVLRRMFWAWLAGWSVAALVREIGKLQEVHRELEGLDAVAKHERERGRR